MRCSTLIVVFGVFFMVYGEIVEIENGKINGTSKETVTGRRVYAFQRIPFAKPPLGKLRFQAPQPVDNWDDVLDATQPGPKCHQTVDFIPNIPASEDCLHLNVYTKNLTDLKPVIVYVHSGGFEMGTSREVGEADKHE
jgi:carboxylesterase type B